MALPTIGHLHPEFCKVMDDCKAGVQYAFQTNNKMTLVLSSTGHSGMECVMTNLLEKDDVVLIANHGIWGERAMDMARRQGKFLSPSKTSRISNTLQILSLVLSTVLTTKVCKKTRDLDNLPYQIAIFKKIWHILKVVPRPCLVGLK